MIFSLVLLFVFIQSTVANLNLEVSSYYHSNLRDYFTSDNELTKELTRYHSNFFVTTQANEQLHPYLIKLHKEDCGYDCHQYFFQRFGRVNYGLINHRYATVLTTSLALEQFTTDHPDISFAYDLMHPQLRISSSIKELTSSYCTTNTQDIASHGLKIRVILATDISGKQYKEYQYFEKEMLQAHVNEMTKEETTNSRDLLILSFKSCQHVLEIVNKFANRVEVLWMEREYPVHTYNRYMKGLCQTGNTLNFPMNYYNFTGENEIIGVADTGIDMKHCYFHDSKVSTPYATVNYNHRKVITYQSNVNNYIESGSGHGTHVCGSIGGYAEDSYGGYDQFKGIAFNSKIAFMDIAGSSSDEKSVTPPSNLYTGLFQPFYNLGARIFSNSWGSGTNAYSDPTGRIDKFLYDYSDSMIFFAAGNDGPSTRNINTFGVNKNGITVGASLNDHNSWRAILAPSGGDVSDLLTKDNLAYFSSSGPTNNNLLKPDIVAPGYYIYSAKGSNSSGGVHCDLQGLSGTSMATPIAAGFASLVRQYFRQGYYPSGEKTRADKFIPSGSLLKAMLVHSAQPLTSVVKYDGTSASTISTFSSYPNVNTGYGRIQLNKVLNFGASTKNPLNLFVVGASNSTQKNYAEVSNSNKKDGYVFKTSSTISGGIRVTLVYTDPITTYGTFTILNNLTVSVRDTNGNVYQRYKPSDATQFSNTQVVDIPSPLASTTYYVNVTVQGSLTYSPQPYALVVTGDSLTFLPDYYEQEADVNNNYTSTTVSSSVAVYIAVLTILAAILLTAIYYFRRVTAIRNNVFLDPKMMNDSDMDFDFDREDSTKNANSNKGWFGFGRKPSKKT